MGKREGSSLRNVSLDLTLHGRVLRDSPVRLPVSEGQVFEPGGEPVLLIGEPSNGGRVKPVWNRRAGWLSHAPVLRTFDEHAQDVGMELHLDRIYIVAGKGPMKLVMLPSPPSKTTVSLLAHGRSMYWASPSELVRECSAELLGLFEQNKLSRGLECRDEGCWCRDLLGPARRA